MTNAKMNGSLVSVQWLAENLDAENLVILDASMPPVTAVDSDKKHEKPVYIPGTRRFDFDKEIRDKESHLPHMMPSPEKFAARVRKLGLGDGNRIVVYDGAPMLSACRVWWRRGGAARSYRSSWHPHIVEIGER